MSKHKLDVYNHGVDGIFGDPRGCVLQPMFSLKDEDFCVYCEGATPGYCMSNARQVPQGEPSPYSWLGG